MEECGIMSKAFSAAIEIDDHVIFVLGSVYVLNYIY
jgi:hypothetical protein